MNPWTKFLEVVSVGVAQGLVDKLFKRKQKQQIESVPTVFTVEDVEPDLGVSKMETATTPAIAQNTKLLRFNASTGLLVKPSDHGGIVVLMPSGFIAQKVWLEGPRGKWDLELAGFANPHKGVDRQHWRERYSHPLTIQRKLGRVGKVKLVVDGHKVLLPKKLTERME